MPVLPRLIADTLEHERGDMSQVSRETETNDEGVFLSLILAPNMLIRSSI